MSNTKGSMLISNANAVGTELINQLGGTGYTPSEWSDAINLLGISDDDKASALAGITEGSYTGSERGAIKYSNCNAVGAMLNKKFSTNRGFKPVEWESAISKLTPLAEGTVSGSICNIVNGADQVPLKNWLVTLPASLSGYSSVTAYQAKKNLLPNKTYQRNANTLRLGTDTLDGTLIIPKGTFTISVKTAKTGSFFYTSSGTTTAITTSTDGDYRKGTFTLSEETELFFHIYVSSGITAEDVDEILLEVGSNRTSYEAYSAPTQYMASLGRTIYGGEVDIISGEGEVTYKGFTLDNLTWSGGVIGGQMWCWYVDLSADGLKLPANSAIFDGICDNYSPIRYNGISSNANTIALRNNGYLYVNNGSDTVEPTGNVTIALDATDTFTFTPITADTELGTNNFWSEQGDSSITYRKDPDIPDPPVQLLNMNNNNTEENNNEGV